MKRFGIRRWLSMGLIFAAVLSVCGCAPVLQAEGPQGGAPVKLVWWQLGPKPDDYAAGIEEINEYLKTKLNVNLELRYATYDYSERMARVINSGEYYDMAFTSSWTNPFLTHATEGAFADLTGVLPKTGRLLMESIPSTLWEAVTIREKVYGIPVYKDSAFSPYFVFNRDDLDELGLNAADYDSLEKLEPALAAYKRAHPGGYPLIFTAGEEYHGFFDEFDMLLGNQIPLGVALDDESATVVNPFETETVREKWDLLHTWYRKGYINPDCMTRKEAPKVRFCYGGHGYPYADVTSWSNDYPAVAVQRYESALTTGSVTGAVNAVSVLSRYPEECVAVLDLIDSDAYLRNLLAYGIENVHYEKTGLTSIRKRNENWTVSQLCQGTYFNLYTVDPAPADMWDLVKEQTDQAKQSPILGFSFDPTPVAAQVAQVKNKYAAYLPLAMSGAVERESLYGEMMEALWAEGLDAVIAEAQRQVDEWRAGR